MSTVQQCSVQAVLSVTLAEFRAESFCASFSILMYSGSRTGTGVVRLGEEGTGGEAWLQTC